MTDSIPTLAVVDGGMVCGWRRSTPSLAQLHQAVVHLHAAHPDVQVAVVADPALKHQLSTADQPLFDADIEIGAVVCAPAGTLGGFQGFLEGITKQSAARGLRAVVVTDRAVPGATLGKVRLDGGRWIFDLTGTASPAVSATAPRRGGNRRRR